MKIICKAQSFGLNTTAKGILKIISNHTDIKNLKQNNIIVKNFFIVNRSYFF